MVKNTEVTKEILQRSSIAAGTAIETDQLVTIASGDRSKDTLPSTAANEHRAQEDIKKETELPISTLQSASSNLSVAKPICPTRSQTKDETTKNVASQEKELPVNSKISPEVKGALISLHTCEKSTSEATMQLTVSGSGGPSNNSGGASNSVVAQGNNITSTVSSPPGPGPGGISSQHSPGSSSTSSSTSGGGGSGYTRTSNPRPRSYKHNASINHSSVGTNLSSSKHNSASNGNSSANKTNISTSVSSATSTIVTSTSLPPSAVSAAPYIPPSHVMIHQPHLDTSYTRAPPPPGLPAHHGGSNQMSHHPHMHASHPAQTHMSPVPPTYCVPPGDPASGGHPIHGCPPPPPPPGVPPAGASWICYPHYDSSIPPGAPPIPGVPSPHGGTHIPTFVHHVGTQQMPPPPMAQHQPAAITNVQINASASNSASSKSSNENSSCKGRSSIPSVSISSNNYSHQQSSPSSVATSCQSSTCAMTLATTAPPTTVVTSAVTHPHPPPPPAVMAPPPHVGSPQTQPPHVVNYHVHQGEVVSLQMGDGQVEVIHGKKRIYLHLNTAQNVHNA